VSPRRSLLAVVGLAGCLAWGSEAVVHFRATLRHRDVRALAGRVQEELGPGGVLRLDPAANSLSVTDEQARIDGVRALLQSLDVPARRFALQAEFGVFAPEPGAGILREGAAFADATAWLERARPTRGMRAVVDLAEGGAAETALLPGYTLRVTAEGYDPGRRRLAFSSLTLSREDEGRRLALLSGRAVLPEGEATVFLLAPEGSEACRLSLAPSLLPSGEAREVP